MPTLIDRLLFVIEKKAGGKHTVFAKKAGIPPSTFQGYINGRVPHVDHLIRIRETFFINIDWLLSGEGDPFIGSKSAGKIDRDEDPETAELIDMTREIINSETNYSFSLKANIRSFHHAMRTEEKYNNIERRIARIENGRNGPSGRIREGDPPASKEEQLKKRAT